MTPEFCVCVCNNSYWWLQDFGNDADTPRLYWTIDSAAAYRFTQQESAIAMAQIVKHVHPEVNVRLIEAPYTEAPHDANPA